MEDRPYIPFQRKIGRDVFFWASVALAASTRLYYSFHTLISDEIFNLFTIETLVSGKGFHPYFFKHPPLYTLLSALLYYIIGPYPQIPSYISIFFSVASLIPFYLIAEDLIGEKPSLWAVLLLSVMPNNVYFSTWIKQDAMLLFFFLWAVYLYLKGRYFTAALFIGFAMLIKEFALLFFPLAFLITIIGSGGRRWYEVWRGWIITVVVSLGISLWWYVLFGYLFFLIAGEALTGAYVVEFEWHFPWWYFFRNLPFDLSYPIFALFLTGILLMGKELYKKGFLLSCYIPLCWIAVLYIPISLLHVKTPWFVYLATPAMAMVAGFGVARLTEAIDLKAGRIVVYALVSASIIYLLLTFDFLRYSEQVTGSGLPGSEIRKISQLEVLFDIEGRSWDEMTKKKGFWEGKIKGLEGKVGFLEYTPILCYLMGITEERVYRPRVTVFMALDKDGMFKFFRDNDIGAFVLYADSLTYTRKNLNDMISLWGEPEKVGPLLFFKTR